jgi:hypothetical protein
MPDGQGRHFYGGYGIVGGSIPLAVGLAFAIAYREEDSVALAMFGDGAVNQGVLAEVMNMAELWRLPVVCFVLNNQYGMGTAVERASAETDLSADASTCPPARLTAWRVAVRGGDRGGAPGPRGAKQHDRAIAYRYRGPDEGPDTTRGPRRSAGGRATRWSRRVCSAVVTRESRRGQTAAERAVGEVAAFAEEVPPEELARHLYASLGDGRAAARRAAAEDDS